MNVYEVYSIYYDTEYNLFEDLEGNMIYDIFKYLSPGELQILKDKRGTLYKDGPPGVKYEIVVPLFEEDGWG